MAEQALARPRMGPQEYLDLEQMATSRHEFIDGVAYAMAGASLRHNDIALDFRGMLKAKLTKPCRPYALDVKLQVGADLGREFFYPDVLVTCSELDNDTHIIKQPVLLVEVLSESTRDYDKIAKFDIYRTLPSLQEYLLIEQDVRRVELFRKRTSWAQEIYETGAQVLLESIAVTFAVDQLY